MKTVLVFKTSVVRKNQIRRLRPLLNRLTESDGCWNFDLDDCDNILRVEVRNLRPVNIAALLQVHGFNCEEL